MAPKALGSAAGQAGPIYTEPEGWKHTVHELLCYCTLEEMDDVPGVGSAESWGEEGRARFTPSEASPPIPQDLQSISLPEQALQSGRMYPIHQPQCQRYLAVRNRINSSL